MVALMLITLSFGIWMMTFTNIDFGQGAEQLQYSFQIDAEFSRIIKDETYFNQDYFVNEIAYSRSITFLENEHFLSMELLAFRDGKMIGKRKEIIYMP